MYLYPQRVIASMLLAFQGDAISQHPDIWGASFLSVFSSLSNWFQHKVQLGSHRGMIGPSIGIMHRMNIVHVLRVFLVDNDIINQMHSYSNMVMLVFELRARDKVIKLSTELKKQ